MANVNRELDVIGLNDTANTLEVNETIEILDSLNGTVESPSTQVIYDTLDEASFADKSKNADRSALSEVSKGRFIYN
jgi:hypothetical protein